MPLASFFPFKVLMGPVLHLKCPHFCAQELELLEDVWRGEVQDLLSQITQLQAENKRLLVSLSLKETPVTEEDLQKHEGELITKKLSARV